jgi:energy-coupling factor transport system ATP-binding protein
MEDMARFCEEIIVMARAKVVMKGKCGEIFSKAELLEQIGLDVPQITRLVKLLENRGVEIKDGIYTVEDAVAELSRILSSLSSERS